MPLIATMLGLIIAADCPAPAAPPPELAAWSDPRPLAAGRDAAEAAALPVGEAARVALHPNGQLSFPIRPTKPGPGAQGGLVAFDAPAAGRYRVALSAPAWIDLVRDGRAVPSAAHAHGPACTGVRKMVDFDLGAGRHLIGIAGSPDPQVTLLVIPVARAASETD